MEARELDGKGNDVKTDEQSCDQNGEFMIRGLGPGGPKKSCWIGR